MHTSALLSPVLPEFDFHPEPAHVALDDSLLVRASDNPISRLLSNIPSHFIENYSPPLPPSLHICVPSIESISSTPLTGEESSSEPLTFKTLYAKGRYLEQKAAFEAIERAATRTKEKLHLTSLVDATKGLSVESIAKEQENRLYHLICCLGALDTEFPQDTLFEKAKEALAKPGSIEEQCQSVGIRLTGPSCHRITAYRTQEKVWKALQDSATFSAEKHRIISYVHDLETLLNDPPQDTEGLEERNRKILLTLRSIYSSSIYKALSTSNIEPLIDLLHTVALDHYTNAFLSPAFEVVGRMLPERSVPERVQTIWDNLAKVGIDDGILSTLSHYSFCWIITKGLMYIALKIAQFLSLHWLIPYIGDERSILGNTPGATVDEIQTSSLKERKIRTIVLSAPTLGKGIAPEFRAALQALENNQFSEAPKPFLTWAYTNLQNLAFTPEHMSTITLMKLQQEYPLSFQAITLPQNITPLNSSSFSEEEVKHHLSQIFQDQTLLLENRGRSDDAGYYIHFLLNHRQEVETIAKDAYRTIDRLRGSHPTEVLKNAYIRLFHLGLVRFHESLSFNLLEQRTHRTAFSVLRSTICASCIDRGGQMNTAYLHALNTSEDLSELVLGAYFGRAILNHRRSPTKASADNLSDLFSVVSQKDANEFLNHITKGFTASLQKSNQGENHA